MMLEITINNSLCCSGANRCTTTGDSLEATLDVGDRSSGSASFALKEEETSFLLQNGLGRTASLTSDIFLCWKQKMLVYKSDLKTHKVNLLMYFRSTLSICFCWNRPLMISWLAASTEPLVPNSVSKKACMCFGWRWRLCWKKVNTNE